MLQVERLEKIMDLFYQKNKMTNQQLCELLFCSMPTLRRDLIRLEKDGLIKRWHGGASLISQNNNELSYLVREYENLQEKEIISVLANAFITDSQALFLDSSSTVTKLCDHLVDRRLVIVTNGIQNIIRLNQSDSIDLFALGGQLKPRALSVVGSIAGDFLKSFNADLAIISCRGLSPKGIFEADSNQAFVKQQMIKHAKKTILLCDEHKFDCEHFIKSANFEEIDVLITNSKPSDTYIKLLSDAGCQLVYRV